MKMITHKGRLAEEPCHAFTGKQISDELKQYLSDVLAADRNAPRQ